MSQVNINPPSERVVEARGDRTASAGINLITVLVILAVLAALAWFLFTGPLRNIGGSAATPNSGNTSITVNNPPANPASGTGAGGGSTSGGSSTTGATGGSSGTGTGSTGSTGGTAPKP